MNSDDEFSPNVPKRRRGRPISNQQPNAAPPKRSSRPRKGRKGPSQSRQSNLRRHEIIRVGDASSDSDDTIGHEEKDRLVQREAEPVCNRDTDSLARILGVADCDNSALVETVDVNDDCDSERDFGSLKEQSSELPSNVLSNSELTSMETTRHGYLEKDLNPEPVFKPSISADEKCITSSISTAVSNTNIDNQGSASTSSATVAGPPKKSARRGLAKKIAGVGSIGQVESSEFSQMSAVYTQCVGTGHLQAGPKVTTENSRTSEHNDTSSTVTSQSESEEDVLKSHPVDVASKSTVNKRVGRQKTVQESKFYNIDTQDELNDSADVVSLDPVTELRSPTPPPEMKPKGKGPVRNRRPKKLNQKLSNALQAINNVKGTLEKLGKQSTPHRGKRGNDIVFMGEEEAVVKDDIVVKVRYLSTVHRIHLNMDESLYVLVERLCEKLGGTVEKHHLCLFLHDQDLVQSKTPRTLGLSVADIIDCHQITGASSCDSDSEDMLNIVIQCRHSRTKTTVAAHKDQPLKEMMVKYAELKGLNAAKLKLSFDGENVDLCHTPSRLDIEDMDVLDIIMC